MFNPDHARKALDIIENTLVGNLGIKTLDPGDWNFRGTYDMSNETTDYHTAKGFNYHNGPVLCELILKILTQLGMGLGTRILFESQDTFQQPT